MYLGIFLSWDLFVLDFMRRSGTGYGAELHKEQQEKGEKPSYDHYAEDLGQAAQWILERK